MYLIQYYDSNDDECLILCDNELGFANAIRLLTSEEYLHCIIYKCYPTES